MVAPRQDDAVASFRAKVDSLRKDMDQDKERLLQLTTSPYSSPSTIGERAAQDGDWEDEYQIYFSLPVLLALKLPSFLFEACPFPVPAR